MRSRDYFGYTVFEDGTILSKTKGTPMSSHDNGRGYLIIGLRIENKSRVKAVHRVLAEAFIPNPDNLSDVDHIDGNKRHNHVSNLRWITHGGNIQHCYNLSHRSAKGEKNARCKTTEAEVRHICELLSNGVQPAEIRDSFQYSYNLIRSIKIRRNWKYISKDYLW
jgi:hypothetical protein